MAEEKPLFFTQEEWEQNAAYNRELIELMRTGNAILFVGSGCTSQIDPKYLRWNELIEELAKVAKDIGCHLSPDINKLKYAHDIKEALRRKTGDDRRYYAKIYDIYIPDKKTDPGELHKKLVNLPVKGFITSNYDVTFELALYKFKGKAGKSITLQSDMPFHLKEFLHSLHGRNEQQGILHIHGIYDQRETIILTLGDYNYAYRDYGKSRIKIEDVIKNQIKSIPENLDEFFLNLQNEVPNFTLHRKVLWALFSTQQLVFVGYGMEEDIKSLLETVCDDLLAWDTPYHYAIMEATPRNLANAKELEKKHGVRTVFYENKDGTHQNLVNLLSDICDKCNIGAATTQPTVLAEEVAPLIEAPRESTVEGEAPWMKGITEASKRRARPDENQ